MTTHKEALTLALEALEQMYTRNYKRNALEAITAIREALAQPELTFDGLTPTEFALRELYEFQEATGCDTAAEFKAQPEQEQDRQIDQLIQERDHRDEIIDKLCDAVLGPDRYEWSSQYFFEDAVREVEERMAALEAQPKQEPVAWMYPDDLKRFETNETFAQSYSIEMVGPTQGATVPLYTTPPQRKPLELDEMVTLTYGISEDEPATQEELYNLIRKVEAAHGIKE